MLTISAYLKLDHLIRVDADEFHRVRVMSRYQYRIWSNKILPGLAAITALICIQTNPAQAKTKFVNFTISSNGNQNFQSLVQQVETLANNSLKQQFAENLSITDISVTVVGEHNGQEVPLLFTKVSSSNWQTEPKFKQWTRYFNRANVLLGFLNPQSFQATSSTKRTIVFKSTTPKLKDELGFRDD